jgi:hypothetical protein
MVVRGAIAEAGSRSVIVKVQAGPHDRESTPILFPLPVELQDARAFRMEDIEDGQAIAVQRIDTEAPSVAWIVRGRLPAGTTRRYRLEPVAESRATVHVRCADDGKALTVTIGGRPVLRYHHAVLEPPSGIEPLYRRSGFIHPLLSPSGHAVTDDFAPDHPHQHGLFFAWVNTTFEVRHPDFWNQKAGTARIRHAATLRTVDGPVLGGFSVRLRHEELTSSETPRPVLDEVWTARVYSIAETHVVDFESRQSCAGSERLTVNKYHYGGLGLRGNRAWFDNAVKGNDAPDPSRSGRSDFLTSEGKARRDGNHSSPDWVDLSGLVDGHFAGITILGSRANFRAPQPVRLHPNKPYLCLAPMVSGEFEIAPGKEYVSRYRLLVHDGPPDPKRIERAWNDYSDPPQVHIVEAP